MKPAIRIIKTALLCFLMFAFAESNAQLLPTTFTTTQGQCVDLGIDTNVNGITIDSFTILSPPANGQIILLGGLPDSWFYCPDSGFVGTDQAFVYYCVIGGTFPVCDSAQFTFIVEPPSTCNLSVSLQSGSCAGPLPSLMAVVTGGIPPYTYLWSDSSTGSSTCNANPGVLYCVQVTDSRGCTDVDCDSLSTGCNLTIAIQNGPCAGPLPSLMAVVTGGNPPYQYLWNNGNANDVICNLATGAYCVTVIDANNCSVSSCQQVGGGCQLVATVFMDSSNCLIPVVNGGTPPFTYTWSDNSTGSTLCNVNSLNTYYVVVTDSNGCVFTATYGGGCQITAVVVVDSMMCGGSNGLYIVLSGGNAPYTYAWSDGSTTSSICPNNPGTYCVTITDAQGCMDIQCGNTGGGCQINVTLVSDSLNNCLDPVVSGGTPPYSFFWSDSSTGSFLCNVTPGASYCVTVVDANGCAAAACNGANQPCTFTYTQNGPALQTLVVFVASFDQQLNPANIIWDLGDGTTASGFQITHFYNACDFVFDVTMTLVDTNGNNLCSYSQYVYVYCDSMNRYCQSSFVFYQDSTNNMTFHFIDQSVYNPVAYQWDFGDGNFSSAQNPSHTYITAGIYNVCLVVTDATGCASTSCQQVNAGNVQIQDLAVYHYHYTTVTPGFPLWSNLSYCNYGTILMSGTVEYRYPTGTTFVSATPAPASHDASQRLLTFNFSNLLPGTCGYIAVDLNVDASLPLGSVANDTVWVKPIAGDINPANNISTITETVIGSWDPNDKAVSPKGIGDDGEIPMNTQTLVYKIRFQNTGTAPAVNVVIRDAIDTNIDLTSVRVMDASHEHITQIIGNELVVTFNNIMLPDSNSNEPESHGYIQVVANLKPGLTEGTQISNTAAIYFDFNEPVITNTVVNTMKDATGIRQIAGFNFSIMPNPAQEQILLTGKFSRNAQYEIINELGQIVLNDDITSDKMQVNIKDLKPGMYFVKIISNDKTGVQRLVVSR